MREIKFRGYSRFLEKWFFGDLIHDDKNGRAAISQQAGLDEVIPETVGQYTGLKDKNGVEIYEGDTVRCVYDGMENIYVVVFDESELDFKGTNGKVEYGNHFEYLTCCEEVEAIGNIYNNPELLKGVE